MSASRPPEIPDTTPTIGRGRYFVVNRLGEGGLAGVYRAWDSRLRVWRAVKILFPQFAHNEQVRRRFGAEAHAMARLVHDNLVRIYDVDEDGALPFLVMELVDGGTLHDWVLRYGLMSPRQAANAVQQVAAGIGAAHEAGVIHRDVKPQNVLITPAGMCKLTDFGVARQLDHEQTLDGVPLGTRGYMAPEQYRDAANVDSRADIFGLGATLWTLLTGRLPPDRFDVLGKPELLEMVPKPLRPVIRVCCAQQAAERLKRADSLERALSTAKAQLPPDPPDSVALNAPLLDTPDIGDWIDFPEIRPVLERPGQNATPTTDHDYASTPATDPTYRYSAAPVTDPSFSHSTPNWRLASHGSAGGNSWSTEPPSGDPPSTSVIPYSMPNVQGKATPLRDRNRVAAEDYVPDYIDEDEFARATPSRLAPPVVDLQRPSQEVIEVGPRGAVPTGSLGPPSTPPVVPPGIVTSTPAPAPPRAPSHPPAPPRQAHAATPRPMQRHSTPPPLSRRTQQANLAAVIGAGIVSLIALMLVFTLLVSTNALNAARTAVEESRAKVHANIQDLGPMIGRLQADNKDALAEAFLDYGERRSAGEPARINAALRLLDQFEQAVPIAVATSLERATPATTKARRLKAIREHYEADLSHWHDQSSRFPGVMVMWLGMVSPPPEAEAW